MSIHRSHLTGAALTVVLAGAAVACGGAHGASKPPASATAEGTTTATATPRGAPAPHAGLGRPESQGRPGERAEPGKEGEQGDAELVVSREVVAHCPTLRLVREHVSEFDPDMVWLAVLESIADCMSEGGPMASHNLGVSGDEEHRHVVREVLGSRGVAPTRVVAKPARVAPGAAECQGGEDCGKRVEITIIAP